MGLRTVRCLGTAAAPAGCEPALVSGRCPRRDTSQMGIAMNCGNVEGILVVEHELPLPARRDLDNLAGL